VDNEGIANGYLRLDASGRILERGKRGTAGPLASEERLLRGVALPWGVNGHTHLADGVWLREPPRLSLAQLVAPPGGLKHRILRDTPDPVKRRSIRGSLLAMARAGVAGVVDFREEGLRGVRLLRDAARGLPLRVWALGRPSTLPATDEELGGLLAAADGLGLSALKDLPPGEARRLASASHRSHRILALHASERTREDLDPILRLRPDLLVHLCKASAGDLDQVRRSRVGVAVCPRSNALFQRFPPLAALEAREVPFLLGTDNAMFGAPDLFREMEFAYLSARGRGQPVRPETLVRAVFVNPWNVLGAPQQASLLPGSPAGAILLRVPTEDPAYQVVARSGRGKLFVPPRPGPFP
jgi:cytosine/adenosine deaminase-related metal-dependent hydrolase